MNKETKRKWQQFLKEYNGRYENTIRDWLPHKRGEELIAVMDQQDHKLYLFLDKKRDRWSLYCPCKSCNGKILRLVKTARIYSKIKKLL